LYRVKIRSQKNTIFAQTVWTFRDSYHIKICSIITCIRTYIPTSCESSKNGIIANYRF